MNQYNYLANETADIIQYIQDNHEVIPNKIRSKIQQGSFVNTDFRIESLNINNEPVYSCEDEMNHYSSIPILFDPNTLETCRTN